MESSQLPASIMRGFVVNYVESIHCSFKETPSTTLFKMEKNKPGMNFEDLKGFISRFEE
jgi:hypothetical protein